MKFTFAPFSKISLYLYLSAVPLLIFCWIDQWMELFLLPDLLRMQLFILAIIEIAIAAIINLTGYLLAMFSTSTPNDQ